MLEFSVLKDGMLCMCRVYVVLRPSIIEYRQYVRNELDGCKFYHAGHVGDF